MPYPSSNKIRENYIIIKDKKKDTKYINIIGMHYLGNVSISIVYKCILCEMYKAVNIYNFNIYCL